MSLSWVLLMALSAPAAAPQGDAGAVLGKSIDHFKLRDYRGAWHELDDYKDKKAIVVVFLGTECPLVKLYAPRLAALHRELEPKGAVVLGVNANQHDSISEIAQYASVNQLPFPILKDVGNKVADQFGATRTPQAFVLDENRKIRYSGRIDDQYGVGYSRTDVHRRDLALAVEDVLAGREVAQPLTPAVGCLIGRVREVEPTGDVTYTNQVSRILQKRCVECHRDGQLAPFSLTDYDEVVGWAETIAEVIEDQRMPPWHADPKYGKFSNDSLMPEEEKETIFRWVENGTPKGDSKDLPEPIQYAEGWRIPTPDLVVSLPEEFTVLPEGEIDPKTGKPTGQVPYKYFQADHVFEEDTWVQAAEARPGNPSVVHHIIVFVKPPGGKDNPRHGELTSDWLVATAPGAMPLRLPSGMAKKIPKGSRLVFQMHYTPNGTTQVDRSSVGLVFADPATVKKEVATDKAFTHKFVIPPHADNHKVEAKKTFDRDVLLLSMFPHMHLRGKSFRYIAEFSDGRPSEILLDIPRYDFKWQNCYILAEPLHLPKGSSIRCIAHYDNSKDNPANPDPSAAVRWGDQTWEEMMIGYFDMALADQDLTVKQKTRTEQFLEQPRDAGRAEALKSAAAGALESPQAFKQFAGKLQHVFPQLDRMCVTSFQDGMLTVDFAVHSQYVRREVANAGHKAKTVGFVLRLYAKGGEPVVHNELTKAPGLDLRAMSRAFSSSLHIPATVDGKPATINFWSVEPGAFPSDAEKLLVELAKQMTKGES